ncbi:MAG TPA: hypothetical protein VEZ11_17400 [Thermoanaerobaculia bacterium]|nr:hypothetical protein [Thermoanaerobaculia bacterium]
MREPTESWEASKWLPPEQRGPNSRAAALIFLSVVAAGILLVALFIALRVLEYT